MKNPYPQTTNTTGKQPPLKASIKILKQWWKARIKFPDPGYHQLIYATRTLLTLVIAGIFYAATHIDGILWLTLSAFLTTLSQTDIGFKNQTIRLLITGLLCIIGVFIGSLAGNNHWIQGILLFVLASAAYESQRYNKMHFVMLLMPLFALLIASAHPANLSDSLHRMMPAAIGALIAFLTGIFYFPYQCQKTITAIIDSISYYCIDFYNYIFLSYLTGNERISHYSTMYKKLLQLLSMMNQHLVYLSNPTLDKQAKQVFNLFAQGYFIARLLHEPSNTDEWLYLTSSLEIIRKDIKHLMISWHNGDQEKISHYANKLIHIKLQNNSREVRALANAVTNIARTIQGLSTCNMLSKNTA